MDQLEYTCDNCDYKSKNINKMKKHVKLHKLIVKCKTCDFESKDTDELIKHVVDNHKFISSNTQQQTQQDGIHVNATGIQCYSCGQKVNGRKELTNHRKEFHFKEKLCRFYHGNGHPCRFPEHVCIDIHEGISQPPVQRQQRQSVIQPNSQYRKSIPCRDGLSCAWAASEEGCRYFHNECRAPGPTTAVNNEQLKELIMLVQAGPSLQEKEQTTTVPSVNDMADFPGIGYSKSKSD